MNVLGLSSYFHDSAAALVAGGRVVAAAEEERFTGRKHDPSFPEHAVRHCLATAGLTAGDLDAVVFYEEPHTKFSRVLGSTLTGFPRTAPHFVRAMRSWLTEKLWTRHAIASSLGVDPRKVELIPHHASHSAHAFLTSPYEEAAVLVVDAVGEWACTTIAHASRKDGFTLKPLDVVEYPHSLGLAYAAFTAFLGFAPNDAECSTMALAAFGRPRYREAIAKVIRPHADGTYELDLDHFDVLSGGVPFSRALVRLLGQPRNPREPLPFTSMDDGTRRVPPDAQRYADIAASVQVVLEDRLLGLARRARELTGSPVLCLGGGVALNCVANSRLRVEGPFREVFVPVDPGDGGAAVGAAMAVSYANGVPVAPPSPYLGSDVAAEGAASVAEELLAKAGGDGGWSLTRYDDESALCDDVAGEIAAGRVVGWAQGRFELGPRALGNRSIFFSPRTAALADRVSTAVKHRARYRPYALTIAEEDATELLDLPDGVPPSARWMQLAVGVKEPARARVRAGLHIDGTTRPQVCGPRDNPLVARLLAAVKGRTGTGAVVNTSFNERGSPIVAGGLEALRMFERTAMDTLVVGPIALRKEKLP